MYLPVSEATSLFKCGHILYQIPQNIWGKIFLRHSTAENTYGLLAFSGIHSGKYSFFFFKIVKGSSVCSRLQRCCLSDLMVLPIWFLIFLSWNVRISPLHSVSWSVCTILLSVRLCAPTVWGSHDSSSVCLCGPTVWGSHDSSQCVSVCTHCVRFSW